MTYEEYVEKTHEIINEIRDLCNTGAAVRDMSAEETRKYFWGILGKIEFVADYPEDAE